MLDLDLSLAVAPDKAVLKHSAAAAPPPPTTVLVKGLISKPVSGQGRATGSRQFFYVNGRPFSPARVAKAFNEVYRQFNMGSFPCVVADFRLPTGEWRGAISPAGRCVCLSMMRKLTTRCACRHVRRQREPRQTEHFPPQ